MRRTKETVLASGSPNHDVDLESAESRRPYVRLELDKEAAHVEGERLVRPRTGNEPPAREGSHALDPGQIAGSDAKVDVLDGSLARVRVKEPRGQDPFDRQHVDAGAGALEEHALEGHAGVLVTGPLMGETEHGDLVLRAAQDIRQPSAPQQPPCHADPAAPTRSRRQHLIFQTQRRSTPSPCASL